MGYGPVEELEVYRMAERAADRIYELLRSWPPFDKNTTGEQLVRAADSIGANIAEGYGRFHFGDQLRFFYFARGSLFETKYWLCRAERRSLLDKEVCENAARYLDTMRQKLNALIRDRRNRREGGSKTSTDTLAENPVSYAALPTERLEDDEWLDSFWYTLDQNTTIEEPF